VLRRRVNPPPQLVEEARNLCNRTVVSGNTFSGNLTAPIRDVGTGTQYP
jgi:hypothetical protein